MASRLTEKCRIAKLVMTIDGQRHVFAAPVPAGQDPMEMTLGEWNRCYALSAAALTDDFFGTAGRAALEKRDE